MDLLQEQNKLQAEANEVLTELHLLEYLSTISTPKLVGSIVTGLMTWCDIDISLTVEPKEEKMWAIAKYIFQQRHIRNVWVADYRIRTDTPFPKGLYVGAKYEKVKGRLWKIDIWLKKEISDVEATSELLKKLNPSNREIILQIKQQVADNPKYRKEIFSTDIYKAVLEDDARDINDFKDYLRKFGKSL